MFNSFFVASVVTVIKVVIDSMAGYAFAKLDFPGKTSLFMLILPADGPVRGDADPALPHRPGLQPAQHATGG